MDNIYAVAFFTYLLLWRLVVLVPLERRFVAHPFDFRSVIFRDLLTTVIYALLISRVARFAANYLGIEAPVPREIDRLPMIARVLLYFVVADLGSYWIHRLMHTSFVWRMHQWHHSPTHMSWSAGNRATFFDATLRYLPYVFFLPLLGTMTTTPVLVAVFAVLFNDWMHLNVRWRLVWLERFIVTPRYHHIHHSCDPAHFKKNFGLFLSVWDHLFGTFFDPDLTPAKLRFGIAEKTPVARLVLGL
jgi:sterol desaturase/sphingolipid hydroxylase (fatty acid hydroxylase superfamily)